MAARPELATSGPASVWADAADLTVVRAGALGDFVVTLPALRALAGPGRRLRLLGNPAARALAPELLAEVVPVDDRRWAGLFADDVPLPPATGGAVVLLKRHREVVERLRRAGWAPILGAAPYPAPPSHEHVGEHLLRAVAPAMVVAAATGHGDPTRPVRSGRVGARDRARPFSIGRPLLEARPGARRAARLRLGRLGVGGPYAVIHPGSGSRRKNWPVARFAEVARSLEPTGARPVVLAGPADEETVAALAGVGPWPVVAGLPLGELVGLLAGAALYVGNDSGVSHLAGAVGAPTVAVFGPTRALRWRPLGPRVEAVEPTARCARCAAAEERPADCTCIERVEVEAVVEAAWRVVGAVASDEPARSAESRVGTRSAIGGGVTGGAAGRSLASLGTAGPAGRTGARRAGPAGRRSQGAAR